MKTVPNLGRVLTILGEHEADKELCDLDLHAFHAPSECYADVNRGHARQFRKIRRRIHGLTGLRYGVAMRIARRLYGDRHIDRAIEHVARLRVIQSGIWR